MLGQDLVQHSTCHFIKFILEENEQMGRSCWDDCWCSSCNYWVQIPSLKATMYEMVPDSSVAY